MPAVPTSNSMTSSDAYPASSRRRSTSTPNPSSPRRTFPNPATSVRPRGAIISSTLAWSGRRGLDAHSYPHYPILHRHRKHHEPVFGHWVGEVQAVPGAQVIAATMPAAGELGPCQSAELQRQRARSTPVAHRYETAVDVGDEHRFRPDFYRAHLARPHVAGAEGVLIHRAIGAPDA